MIQVFCNKRGSGKTKRLIDLANKQINLTKGASVYIDDSLKHMRQIDNRIRFISTNDFNMAGYQNFYGLLCGILSENYDIENIYIDNVLDNEMSKLNEFEKGFRKMAELSNNFNLNIYVNINYEEEEIPAFIREYVA
ncbi:hypothetical protein SAMN04487886_10882 [Clostridium sp. DSM 8431]|uniref:hypothetical protein n=1 Tax=Clostridium sp. DSM 8431 TaxID=1761781 RepID=UPI0008E84D4B|nr:hypothetical protein [Clostridium sp. DSM 8431]SFU65237.1 hypothetical protein SAMN04487886_10882 [Clostridium sp. DSM 8431]